jgi:hypothetical protein
LLIQTLLARKPVEIANEIGRAVNAKIGLIL